MADDSAVDFYEAWLLDSLTDLNQRLNAAETGIDAQIGTEQKNIAVIRKKLDDKRAAGERNLLQAGFGVAIGEGILSEMEIYREQLAELQKAQVLAKDHSPEAIYGTVATNFYAKASYLEKVNLDNAITDWLNKLKTGEQVGLEKFLFGHVIGRQPPKIGKAEEYKHAFETADWPAIIDIYQREYLALEVVLNKSEADLQALVGSNLKETFFPTQPDETTLKSLLEAKGQAESDKNTVQHRLERYLHYRDDVWGLRLAGRQDVDSIREQARRSVEMEEEDEKKKKEEQALTTVVTEGERTVQVTPTPHIVIPPSSSKTAEPDKKTASQEKWDRMRKRELGIWEKFYGVLRHPEDSIGGFFDRIGKNLSGQGTSQLAKEATGQVAGQIVKTTTAKVVTTTATTTATKVVAKGVLSKIVGGVAGAVAAPVGVLLSLKELLTNKEWREKFKQWGLVLGSSAAIGIHALIQLLMANLAVGAATLAGMIGGFIAGAQAGLALSVVFPIFGPLTPLIFGATGGIFGAAGGGVLIYSVANTVWGTLAGASGTAVSAGGLAGAATAPAFAGMAGLAGGAGVSGFGVGTVAGATAAGGGIGAGLTAFLGGGTGIVLTAVVGTGSAAVLTTFVLGSALAMTTAAQDDGGKSEGTLLKVEKTVRPAVVPNNSSSSITYSVVLAAKESDITITIEDKLTREKETSIVIPLEPEEALPTNLTKGESKTIKFKAYTTVEADNDSNLLNKVTVTAKAGNKSETLIAKAMVTVGTPAYAPRCDLGTKACAVSEMAKYFSDPIAADKASRICRAESTGNINAINDSCDPKKNLPPAKRREYSVGLFQINLWGHDLCPVGTFGKPYKPYCVYPDCDPCYDRNEQLLKECAAYWMKPENNIPKAVEMSSHGTHWGGYDKYPTWPTATPDRCNIQ